MINVEMETTYIVSLEVTPTNFEPPFPRPRAFWYDLLRLWNAFSNSSWASNGNGMVDNFQGLFEGTQHHNQALVVV